MRENWVVMLCQLCLSYDIGEGGLGGVSVCVYVWFRMVSVCFERLSVCVCVCVCVFGLEWYFWALKG